MNDVLITVRVIKKLIFVEREQNLRQRWSEKSNENKDMYKTKVKTRVQEIWRILETKPGTTSLKIWYYMYEKTRNKIPCHVDMCKGTRLLD